MPTAQRLRRDVDPHAGGCDHWRVAREISISFAPELRYAPSRRRVRAELGDVVIADSQEAVFVWEPRRPVPLYAFPVADVRTDLMTPAEPPERGHPLADAWSVSAGERSAESAAWTYADDDLAGHVVLEWKAFDRWLEEDEEVFVHPRDPFHRVDLRASSRTVRVELEGAVLAESSNPLILFETGLPRRYYLPPEDVSTELLEESATITQCPYKGTAVQWSAPAAGELGEDVAWTYRDPLPEVARIAGRIAFYDERTDVTLDGVPQERPQTPFSRTPRG
jgi:uncharacterized protein (DUF427 family)